MSDSNRTIIWAASGLLLCVVGSELFSQSSSNRPSQQEVEGWGQKSRAVSIAADGEVTVLGTRKNDVIVWRSTDPRRWQALRGHSGLVFAASLSWDGRRIASASEDNSIRIWDTATGMELRRWDVEENSMVMSLALSADGGRLVSGGRSQIALWDVDGNTRLWDLEWPYIAATDTGHDWRGLVEMAINFRWVAISADGQWLAARTGSGETVPIWRAASREVYRDLPLVGCQAVAFGPDGRTLAALGGRPDPEGIQLKLWDLETGNEIRSLKAPAMMLPTLGFSADGEQVVLAGSAAEGNRIVAWAIGSGSEVAAVDAPDWVSALGSGPGAFAAAGDDVVRLWLAEDWQELHSWKLPRLVPVVARGAVPANLPDPILTFEGTEEYQLAGPPMRRYELSVANSAAYPDALFEAAPDLPPCGRNDNSARAWISIYDETGRKLYGFCGVGKAGVRLSGLWFALPAADPPPREVYIEIVDRRTNTIYTSNRISIPR